MKKRHSAALRPLIQGDLLKNRRARAAGATALALVLGIACGSRAHAETDEAQVEVIKDGFAEPVSVTQVGDTGWVAEGKLSYLIGDNKKKDPGPFALKPVALPK